MAKALPGGQDGLVTLADSGGAVSWDASLEIQPLLDVPFRIGVDYKQQAFMKLKGPANFAFPPAFAATYPNQEFNHVLPYPSTFNVGVAWRPVPAVDLTAGYTYEHYSVYVSDTFVGQTTDPSTGPAPRALGVAQLRQRQHLPAGRGLAGPAGPRAARRRPLRPVGREPRLLQPVAPRRQGVGRLAGPGLGGA